jgi:hypothetical protein
MLSPHDHVIFADVGGVDGVLVDLNAKQYYQLNETASVVWRGLAQGTPVDDIVKGITDVYDVTPEHARSSVDGIIRNFVECRLLKPLPKE